MYYQNTQWHGCISGPLHCMRQVRSIHCMIYLHYIIKKWKLQWQKEDKWLPEFRHGWIYCEGALELKGKKMFDFWNDRTIKNTRVPFVLLYPIKGTWKVFSKIFFFNLSIIHFFFGSGNILFTYFYLCITDMKHVVIRHTI